MLSHFAMYDGSEWKGCLHLKATLEGTCKLNVVGLREMEVTVFLYRNLLQARDNFTKLSKPAV